MEKDNEPYAFLNKLGAHTSHRIVPGQGIRRRTDDQFSIADSVSRIGSRIGGVLEVVSRRHNESLPEISPIFNRSPRQYGTELACHQEPIQRLFKSRRGLTG